VPVGIDEPVISILGDGRLLGEAVVDLDAVSRANPPKGMFDPMRLLTGRLPVRVQGVLTTSRGMGRFSLESASISGLPVPKSVAAVARQPLLEERRPPARGGARRSVRAAGSHPRDPGRAGAGRSSCNEPGAPRRGTIGRRALPSSRDAQRRRRSPRRGSRVGRLETLDDLLVRFPIRYEDRGHPRPLSELQAGRVASAIATIVTAALKKTRRPGFSVFEIACAIDRARRAPSGSTSAS
jgi:hypothetical protein